MEQSKRSKDLEERTFRFAVDVIQFIRVIKYSKENDLIKHQLVKSATSIGANYREANRARSKADFVNKIKICESEASETQYWLEVIVEVEWLNWEEAQSDYNESSELLAIFSSIGRNT